MRIVRPMLLIVAASGLAGCGTPSTHPSSVPPTTRPDAVTPPTNTGGSGGARPACGSGTVTVTAAPGGQVTPVCATVGSVIVLRGGIAGTGGSWPGPPNVSNPRIVSVLSSHAAGDSFTAELKALTPGSTSAIVAFVAGQPVCDPTPCTPIPGAPLSFDVRVVGST